MPRALITGITGFTGRYLSTELSNAGYEVFGTTTGQNLSDPAVYSMDLRNSKDTQRVVTDVAPDVVVHLAAVSFVKHNNVGEIYCTNVVGTHNLLSALVNSDKKPEAVLIASSANVYGNAQVEPITEQAKLYPANDYAVSKLSMEYMSRMWCGKLPIVLVRPFNYVGVGQSKNFLVPKIVEHFKVGAKEISLGNIDVYRDFSDVRIVVKIYRRLLENVPTGRVVNVCSGSCLSLGDVLKMMSEIAGYDIVVKTNPAFVRENEVKRLRGSKKFLEELIGPVQHIPLKETLRWMFRS